MSFFKELQRRNVIRVAMAYGVVAWLLIQVGATLEPAMHLPDWTDSILAFFLLLGFPIAMFFAWAYELTPDGLKRDGEIAADAAERAIASQKWDRLIIFVLVLALGYFAMDKYMLKGSEPFSVQTAEESPDRGAEKTGPTPAEETAKVPISSKSIAVLPFVNMSSDPEQEYFSDGLTEELLNLLADIDDLKVAARTSSFFYKNKLEEIPMREVAQQLGVAHILEGSVRRSGNQIRITAQLIKADSGYHLWSETYDRTLDDVFAIQDEISAAVVDALKVTLLGEAPHARVINTESYELTLQGRFLYNRRSEGDLERALELFEKAVELDPNNVDAWVGLVPLYRWMFDGQRFDDAMVAAKKAVELDPNHPGGLARLAQLVWTQDEEAGMEIFERAARISPDHPMVLNIKSYIWSQQGNFEKSLEIDRRALSVDPLNVVSLTNFASTLVHMGRWQEAESYVLKAMELSPGGLTPATLAEVRLFQGRFEDALMLVENVPDSMHLSGGGNQRLMMTAMSQHSLGNKEASNAALKAYKITAEKNFLIGMAYLHAWRGEKDQAFDWVFRQIETNPDIPLFEILSHYLVDLHDDPRWGKVMAHWPDYNGEEM